MGISQIYGVAKHSLAYSTPGGADETPEEQLTTIGPEQKLVELIDWITWLLMILANGLIKLSALYLYRRIFVVDKRSKFAIATIVMILVCALWTVAFSLATVFGCGSHFSYPWAPLLYIGICNTDTRLDGLMWSDLITGILVWLLPIPMIWSLHMTKSRKFAVTSIFMLAAVSLGAAIVRLIVELQISGGGYTAHTDVNLTLTVLLYWSMIESGLALIAACLPTLQYILARSFIGRVISNLTSTSSHTSLRRNKFSPSESASADGPYSAISDSQTTKLRRLEPCGTWEREGKGYALWSIDTASLRPSNVVGHGHDAV